MRWLIAACVSLFLASFALTGTLVPIRTPGTLEYLFVWSGALSILCWGALGSAAAICTYIFLTRDTAWLRAVALVGLLPLGLVVAVPGVGNHGAAFAYTFYDLRWWWLGLIAVVTIARVDDARGRRLTLALGGLAARVFRARWTADVLLFVAAVSFALATTPSRMFEGRLIGDEPKYLRFAETWYQGNGFDISLNRPLSENRLAPPAVTRNVRYLASAVIDDARSMAADTMAFARHPLAFKWNRATGTNGFVVSKHGTGVYQMHMPGVSAILFPGYFLDRWRLSSHTGFHDEFPAELRATNASTLAIFGIAAILLFRFLESALGHRALALGAAAVAMASMPAAAFAFQFYPEIAALALVLFSARRVLFSNGDGGTAHAALAGAAAGGLLWMHPRFAGVSLVLAAAAAWRWRGAGRRRFFVAWLLVLISVAYYAYHVTGSWMPNAFFSAADDVDVSAARIPSNVLGYIFHSQYGVAANAPWILMAIPGLVLLWRRRERSAGWVALIAGALIAAAAAHSLKSAGGTPDRFVVAVVPLLAWPAAALAREFRRSPAVMALAAFAVIASLETAVAYNRHYDRFEGELIAETVSGWRTNLAFPEVRSYFQGHPEPGYLAFIGIVVLAAAASAFVLRARGANANRPHVPAAASIVSLAAVLTALTAAAGSWTHDVFFMHDIDAHYRALRGLVALDRCRVCATSAREQVDWTWLQPNGASPPEVKATADGRHVIARIDLGGSAPNPAFGRVTVNFGDGTPVVNTGIVGASEVTHDYAKPGTYLIYAELLAREHSTGRVVITLGGQ